MTGLYPIHSGMNHLFIFGNDPWGLPLEHHLLPEYLHDLGGYRCHMIGAFFCLLFSRSLEAAMSPVHVFLGGQEDACRRACWWSGAGNHDGCEKEDDKEEKDDEIVGGI